MVGAVMFLKMLHCKRMNRNKPSRSGEESSFSSKPSRTVNVKTENNRYDDQSTCRVCLKVGNIPIYRNNSMDNIAEALNMFGGIEVSYDDEYPKYLCDSCNALLKGAILLRKTAQESDHVLRQPVQDITMTDNEEDDIITTDDIPYDYNEQKEEYQDIKTNKKDYCCKKCNQHFTTFKEYSDHRISDEHENTREKCPICNNTYTTLYFKKHLLLHKMETPYMCDICGKKFIIQGQFTRHRLTHFYNLPFKCSLCPYRGRFSESLKMHMRSHTGEKPYQCPHCPSRFFVNKSNLNKHLLTHGGTPEFQCSQCQRGFYTKRDLDLHFKVDHSGIKDHLCNICGKAFGYRKQMMKHQVKVHKREKLRSGRTPLYLLAESQKDGEQG